MILSGVGLVAKIRAEKSKKQKDGEKKDKGTDFHIEETDFCEQCQIEARRARTHFQFPSRNSLAASKTSSGYGSIDLDSDYLQSESVGELVTIATGEGHCVYINQSCYTVDLLQDNIASSSSYFRKRVLHREASATGEVETVVFSLDKEPNHYMTTNANKQLELNYFPEEPMLDQPDERVFLVYTTNTNHKIIQPAKFKGFYLHHLDNKLDVTRFDINFRAPEEYFFEFDAVPDVQLVQELPPVQLCTHSQTYKHKDMIPNMDNSGKQKLYKNKKRSVLSYLFFACAGSRSRKTVTTDNPNYASPWI